MNYRYKKITVLTGHYGCGKTNLAVNLAMDMQKYGRVTIVDMDIVNPYFRTADFRGSFDKNRIEIICPQYANTNLDIPVLNFDMERIIRESEYLIVDMGGGYDGAFALGRYREILARYSRDTEVLYVFSMYRSPDMTPEETAEMLPEIERACGMKCTALVNNSNLGAETDFETAEASVSFADRVSELTGLDIAFRCVPEGCGICGNNDFPVRRMVRLPWEE